MTVFDNVAYGLKVRKEDKKVIEKRVKELLELVDLKGLEKRYPHTDSGIFFRFRTGLPLQTPDG